MPDWQRPDIPTRTGLYTPFFRHNPSEEALRLATDWGALVTGGGGGSVNLGDPGIGRGSYQAERSYRRRYWGAP